MISSSWFNGIFRVGRLRLKPTGSNFINIILEVEFIV
jgi:hypothetical protein